MDLLEHQAILGRLQRKHRKAQEEAAALRAQVEEFKSTPPRPDFCSPPPKPAYGRRICVGSCCTRLDAGFSGGWAYDGASPLNSPATGAVPAPPPSAVDFWVAVEANRARHEKAEEKRAKQEERTRLASVLSACAWDKETADPDLLRAAQGFWIGTETQNAGLDRAVGETATVPRRRRYPLHLFVFYLCTRATTSTHARKCIVPVLYSKCIRVCIVLHRGPSAAAVFKETAHRHAAALCVNGFDGRPHAEMEKRWAKSKRFKVARLAKASDVDSNFNPKAVGAMRACEGDLDKGEMGLLCGESSMHGAGWDGCINLLLPSVGVTCLRVRMGSAGAGVSTEKLSGRA